MTSIPSDVPVTDVEFSKLLHGVVYHKACCIRFAIQNVIVKDRKLAVCSCAHVNLHKGRAKIESRLDRGNRVFYEAMICAVNPAKTCPVIFVFRVHLMSKATMRDQHGAAISIRKKRGVIQP